MCSIIEDDFDDNGGQHYLLPNDIKQTNKDEEYTKEVDQVMCHKCGSNNATYKLQFREAECCRCFLLYVRHKFRAALGSSKILPRNANVLLMFDGKAKSLVLLDMVHHALTQNNFKKLDCTICVLYIDDYHLNMNGKPTSLINEQLLKSIKKHLEIYKSFANYVIAMADVETSTLSICNMKNLNDIYLLRDKAREELFVNMINEIKSLTSRQDFIKHYRNKVISHAAKYLKCQYVFKADCNEELAVDLLSAICLGRGGSAALDVALMDDRLEDNIKLLRPLRNLNRMEILLYLKACNLTNFVGISCDEDDDLNKYSSLQNITKSFVNNLQKDFNSTVTTIVSVGDKIRENRDFLSHANNMGIESKSAMRCAFCKSVLDHFDSPTLLAIRFSKMANNRGQRLSQNANTLIDVEIGSDDSSINKLCRGCQNMHHDGVEENFIYET